MGESATRYNVQSISWADAEEARRIRFEVFVDEQQVPSDLEIDATDEIACHVIAYAADGTACGTARLFPDEGEPGCAHVGRMAVLSNARGTGCGSALLVALLAEARMRGFSRVTSQPKPTPSHSMPATDLPLPAISTTTQVFLTSAWTWPWEIERLVLKVPSWADGAY